MTQSKINGRNEDLPISPDVMASLVTEFVKQSRTIDTILCEKTPERVSRRLVAERVIGSGFHGLDRLQAKALVFACNKSILSHRGLVILRGFEKSNILLATKGTKNWTRSEHEIVTTETRVMVESVTSYLKNKNYSTVVSMFNSDMVNNLVGYTVFFSLINPDGNVVVAGEFEDTIRGNVSCLRFKYLSGETEAVNKLVSDLVMVKPSDSDVMTMTTALGVDSKGDLVLSNKDKLDRADIRLGDDLFYPFMSGYGTLTEYFDEFLSSRQPVLILIGPPGTGKSTFVRTMASYKEHSVLSVRREDAFKSVGFMDKFTRGEWDVLLVEDAEQFIKPRESGNTLMSDILNSTDGVSGIGNKKVIFTTNLPDKNSIDEALMREGRCFDVLDFPLLSISEAEAIQNKYILNKELHQDLSTKSCWSLAQILNPPTKRTRKVRQKQAFGFTAK